MYDGVLQSFDDRNLVLSGKTNGVVLVNRKTVRDIRMPSLPSGLITHPTLVWMLRSGRAGKQLCELSYLTSGIEWKADYIATVNADDTNIDLAGWVTIDNKSGATYKNALIKLITGEVHYEPSENSLVIRQQPEIASASWDYNHEFAEKKFFEYHMYTLQRRSTIADRQTKQISLLSADNVGVRKLLIYNGARNGKKVNVKLEFKNSKENHLGMPLPKGTIRVYKIDPDDGTLRFAGEDSIDHTPKDETVRILVGNAFDIVGERKQKNVRRITAKVQEFTYEITVRNHKDKAVDVIVEENPNAWQQWTITKNSHEYIKKSQKKIEFPVHIAANDSVTINYTIRYVY
jgi:hypothetical protein